jgi:ParB/RepB/Spo0J family partition protein
MTAHQQQIPIDDIVPSRTNPRKRFDELEDLAQNITAHGILQPLLVRPIDKQKGKDAWGLVAGERRLRAAKAAGLKEVPCIVRDLTDSEVLEIQVIENLQRRDLHALEEAEGYRRLIGMKDSLGVKYDVAKIAARIGRSPKYVYDRMKLNALVKEIQDVFLKDRITAGHAILLARLKPEDQARAADEETGGLWEAERRLFNPEAEDEPDDCLKSVSVRELEGWIDEHVRFDPEAEDLPQLFPETAAILAKPPEEAEKIVSITHDTYVQPEARDGQRVIGPRSWKRADGKGDAKTCEKSVTGVVVIGPARGEAFRVCTDKKGCKVHWAAEQREAKKRGETVTRSGKKGKQRWELEAEEREKQRAREEALAKRWEKARSEILGALAEKVKTSKDLTMMEDLVIRGVGDNYRDCSSVAAKWVPRGRTAEDAIRHAVFIILWRRLQEYQAPRAFPKLARAFGLNATKIVDDVAPVERACRFCACTEHTPCAVEGQPCAWLGKKGTPLGDVCSGCVAKLSKKERAMCDLHGGPAPEKKARAKARKS